MTGLSRLSVLCVLALGLSNPGAAAASGGRAVFAPTTPVRGGTVTIVYTATGGPLEQKKPVSAEVLLVRESGLPEQKTVALRGGPARWTGSVELSVGDETLLLVQFVSGELVDDDGGNAWHLLVHGPDGSPVRGAHLALAAVLQRSEYYSYRHERDPVAMKQELALEQQLYPHNWRASLMSWGLLMRSPGGEEAAQEVRAQLDSVYAREQGNQAVVAELLPWFDQTGQIDRAESIRRAAIAQDSAGPIARATAQAEVSQERDLAARIEKADKALAHFAWNDRDHDALVAVKVNAYVRLGQHDQAVRAAEESREPQGSLYNSIAWPLVEQGQRLEDAVRWAHRGVEMIRQETVADKPAFLSARVWRSNHGMQLGMILDTYALGLFKLDRLQEAERAYEEADSLFGGEFAETADRLAETYLKNGKPRNALELTRRMIRTGITSEETESLYRQSYLASTGANEGVDAELEELREEAEEHMRQELRASRLSIPAPAFSLASLDGSVVRLEDLRGKVVILDFWATWCGPCKMSFPYLQRFFDRHRENPAIALFAVNTWEREKGERRHKAVRKFLADNTYTFPVLFDESTVEQYGVEGIPTRFVIDQEGVIRFKSVGFEGGDKMLTQMELQVGLLLEKDRSSAR